MSEINFPAIHAAYNDHLKKQGLGQHPTPQPQGVHPMHAMMIHAMSQVANKPGEDQPSMIIRALAEMHKRITPDVSKIHQQPAQPSGGQ